VTGIVALWNLKETSTMLEAIALNLFAYSLGWRGYGWSHIWLAVGIVAMMLVYAFFRSSSATFYAFLDWTSVFMIFYFEVMFFLPGWCLGRGARRVFGGGKPYSLKMSFDV
jgi:uncharacterized membrane protein